MKLREYFRKPFVQASAAVAGVGASVLANAQATSLLDTTEVAATFDSATVTLGDVGLMVIVVAAVCSGIGWIIYRI